MRAQRNNVYAARITGQSQMTLQPGGRASRRDVGAVRRSIFAPQRKNQLRRLLLLGSTLTARIHTHTHTRGGAFPFAIPNTVFILLL